MQVAVRFFFNIFSIVNSFSNCGMILAETRLPYVVCGFYSIWCDDVIIVHKAQLSSQDCASIRILYSEKEGRYELFYFAFIRTRTCRTYRLFRRCMVLKCEKLSNCAPIRPFDSHQMLIKQKDISQGYVFCLVPPCKLKICNLQNSAKTQVFCCLLLIIGNRSAWYIPISRTAQAHILVDTRTTTKCLRYAN